MRKIWIVLAVVAATYAGWHFFGQGIDDLSSGDARKVRFGLDDRYGRSGGTLLPPVKVLREVRGQLVCGWYIPAGPLSGLGRVAFIGLLGDHDGTFSVASIADSDAKLVAMREVCAVRGLNL